MNFLYELTSASCAFTTAAGLPDSVHVHNLRCPSPDTEANVAGECGEKAAVYTS